MVRRYSDSWLKKLKDIVDPNYWAIRLVTKVVYMIKQKLINSSMGDSLTGWKWWYIK